MRTAYQTWTALAVTGPIRDDFIYFLDMHGRFYDDMHPTIVLIQPGLGVKLGHGLTAIASYVFAPSWNGDRQLAEEHRAFEQVTYSGPSDSGVQVIGRVRFEERFRPDSKVGVRMRALFRLNVPLGLSIPLQTVVWDEMFFGLNQPGSWQPEAFDQNWIFTGLGYPMNKHFRMDVGYLGQLLPRNHALTVHHALSINGLLSL